METLLSLRLRLFRLNLISGNQFPENRAFGCAVKFGQTENIFFLSILYYYYLNLFNTSFGILTLDAQNNLKFIRF